MMKKKSMSKESEHTGYVKVNFDDIFWRILVNKSERKNGKSPIIELSWGWGASMSDEEIKQCEKNEEHWQKEKVDLTIGNAKLLLYELNELITKIENEQDC